MNSKKGRKKEYEKKLIGIFLAIMFLLIAIPQTEAVVDNKINENQKIFRFCYIENIVEGDYEHSPKSPFGGVVLIILGGENSETKIYDQKGGEIIAHFETPHIICALFMFGYQECTSNSCIIEGNSFGVFVLGR